MTKTRLRLLALVFYVVVIFIASSIPNLSPPGPEFAYKDKIAHLLEYVVLGGLLFKGIGFGASRSKLVTFGFLLAVGASVGALDELYQSYIPNRSMDIYDWCADTLGVMIGVWVLVFTPLGRKRLAPWIGPAGGGE
ncbi:MAG: VanZ family protein [Candidatus Krumholzibacteriia bacterium]